MSDHAECRDSHDLTVHRTSCARRGYGAAHLCCLLALIVFCQVESPAVAGDGARSAGSNDAARLGPVGNLAANVATPNTAERLITEPENPAEYQALVATSPYPPTEPAHKLTLEQLEAISKLAPKVNKDGWRVHPAMLALFRSMVLHYTGGTYKNSPIRFRLHTPESFQKGKRYPLVVWLHGSGECGSDNINQLSHLHHIIPYLVGPKQRDFFLLVPQCPYAHEDWEAPEICATTVRGDGSVECHTVTDPVALGDAPVAFTLAMIEAVKREFPVDPDEITVAGLSTGGDGVWQIVERRPDLFAAAVPIVSWRAFHEKSLREKPLLKKIPTWAIYSSDDNSIDFARKEFDRVRDAGCNAYKTEFGVCGHRAWTPAMLQGDVFGWLISRAKQGERYFAARPSPTSPEMIGIFADVTEGDLARKPKLAPPRPQPSAEPDNQSTLAVPAQKITVEATNDDVSSGEHRRSVLQAKTANVVIGAGNQGPSTTPYFVPTPANPPYFFIRGTVAPRMVEPSPAPPVNPYVPDPRTNPFAAGTSGTSLPNAATVDECRLLLISRYVANNDPKKALAVADKVKNRPALVSFLLREGGSEPEVLAYIDRELDRMEQHGGAPGAAISRSAIGRGPAVEGTSESSPQQNQPSPRATAGPQQPSPEAKKSPKDDCGKQWEMSTETIYGLFPNGWDQESSFVPDYVINETGQQLRARLFKAFAEDDLTAVKELCTSFIRLDDIPLSSPWFDTSGGRLQGPIKYALNEKSKPVVEMLREIATVKAESKKPSVELARKALARIDSILRPKGDKR